jgi:hypothetical protein
MVLVVSLLVLLLLGIIAGTVARTNQLQLHMAGNDEARIDALQQALAAVDGVLAGAAGISPAGSPGYRVCAAGDPDTRCDEHTLTLAPDALPAAGGLAVALVRVAPLEGRLPVTGEAGASSTVYYRVAKYEVQAAYDATDRGQGRVALSQGLLLRLPSSPQSTSGGSP